MRRFLASRRLRFLHQKWVADNDPPQWAPKGYVWARMRSRPATIKWLAGVEEQNITHHLQLRQNQNLQAGDRLLHDDKIYHVHFVHDPDGRGRRLECFCEERQPL